MGLPGIGDAAAEVLHRRFGYNSFRGQQQEIIEHVCAGGDAIALMPTGSGKSLCYQIPALVREGTGVVISPLIALMQDQVDALTVLGVRAGFLNSTQDPDERRGVEYAFLDGKLDLLYLAPERLRTESALRLLDRGTVALFAIDEAHCVAQWGHDFRPDYLALSVLHERWPAVPRIAVTATATEQTRAEIATRLALGEARQFVASFDRPNIQYRIEPKNEPQRQLLRLLRTEHPGDAGIVYCLSRASVEKTAVFLSSEGFVALPYHAGLDARTRSVNQSRFLREDGLIMVATIAFGMGIDKPDVRFVAHLDLPRSVEGYYQETGRAGRDGAPGHGLAGLRAGGRGPAAADDRRLRRRPRAPPPARGAPGRDARPVRDGGLPAAADAGVLRRDRGGRVRELRHLPGAAFGLGRHGGGAEAALDRGPAGTAERALVRRGAADRHPARQEDAAGAFLRARFPACFRHRQRTDRGRVAGRGAAAAGRRAARGQGRSRHAGADRPERRGAARGAAGPVPAGRSAASASPAPAARGGRGPKAERRAGRAWPGAKSAGVAAELPPEAEALFERLRAWRAAVAKEQGMPAYVIFHDATLRQIASSPPSTLAGLSAINGVGETKLGRYGQLILDVLAEDGPAEPTSVTVYPIDRVDSHTH